jgi:hypothetical protein
LFINAELSQLPVNDGRRAGRRIVNLAAALREKGAVTQPVLVVDVSPLGFKIQTKTPPEAGSEVWLRMPGFEARRSRVIWAEAEEAGCEFESPLHDRDVQALSQPKPRGVVRDLFKRAE